MMMMSTKAVLVAQWIGLLSAGMAVNLHVQALVLLAHLNLPKIATLIMRRHGGTDWLITSPQPEGPTDTRLIPSYGGHITKVIFEGSERKPPILEYRSRNKPLEAIIGLRDMSDAIYDVLPATPSAGYHTLCTSTLIVL